MPPPQPFLDHFECQGCSTFLCLKQVTIWSFHPLYLDIWTLWAAHHAVSKCCATPSLHVAKGTHIGKVRCSSCHHVWKRSIIPFFSGCHMSFGELVGILFCSLEAPLKQSFLADIFTMSRQTVSQWQVFFCECAFALNSALLEITKPTFRRVQVDETAFGKRKYNRGHRVRKNGIIWVWGGVGLSEDDVTQFFFAEYVPKRCTESVRGCMEKLIGPNVDMLISDCWGATIRAMRLYWAGLRHEKVNHSKEFKNRAGFHTNTIECHWKVLKDELKQRWCHAPHDTQLLDDKVQFCVFVINCRLLGLSPFVQYMHMLFSWQTQPTGVDDNVSDTDSEGLEAERSTAEDEPGAADPALVAVAAAVPVAGVVAPLAVVVPVAAPAVSAQVAVVPVVVKCSTCQGFGSGDRRVLVGKAVCKFCEMLSRAANPVAVAPAVPIAVVPTHPFLLQREVPEGFSLVSPQRRLRLQMKSRRLNGLPAEHGPL